MFIHCSFNTNCVHGIDHTLPLWIAQADGHTMESTRRLTSWRLSGRRTFWKHAGTPTLGASPGRGPLQPRVRHRDTNGHAVDLSHPPLPRRSHGFCPTWMSTPDA